MSYLTCDHSRVLKEVAAERERQDRHWGEQNHEDGTDAAFRENADELRAVATEERAAGKPTWLSILAEEVAEAFAEVDPVKLRAELVQCGAVVVAWIEAIDRRAAREDEQP